MREMQLIISRQVNKEYSYKAKGNCNFQKAGADPGISKRGGGVELVCFDAPLHIPYVFLSEEQ